MISFYITNNYAVGVFLFVHVKIYYDLNLLVKIKHGKLFYVYTMKIIYNT
jgi:hypothetical protein